MSLFSPEPGPSESLSLPRVLRHMPSPCGAPGARTDTPGLRLRLTGSGLVNSLCAWGWETGLLPGWPLGWRCLGCDTVYATLCCACFLFAGLSGSWTLLACSLFCLLGWLWPLSVASSPKACSVRKLCHLSLVSIVYSYVFLAFIS